MKRNTFKEVYIKTIASKLIESEREKTNESLNLERNKTNQSLMKAKGKAEKVTNQSVDQKRTESDQTKLALRNESDLNRELERETHQTTRKEQQKLDDQIISQERQEADKIVARERTKIDEAIDEEREKKSKIESEFLAAERKQTDLNLKSERQEVDKKIAEVAEKLDKETKAHWATQNSLTSREEFLAIVSHDLKNPIGAIFSCSEMLLHTAKAKDLDPEITRWINFIKRNADTGLRLIKDLLEMERMAQGKLELNLEQCSLSSILKESIESLHYAAAAKNIELQLTPEETRMSILCDRDRIHQVMTNLIGNAIKFTPQDGIVSIHFSFKNKQLQIEVKDSGCGIPKEKLAGIFDRFAQIGVVDRSGLGLGLYISKMLVEAHGGQLWAESEVNVGSRFYFTLPLESL